MVHAFSIEFQTVRDASVHAQWAVCSVISLQSAVDSMFMPSWDNHHHICKNIRFDCAVTVCILYVSVFYPVGGRMEDPFVSWYNSVATSEHWQTAVESSLVRGLDDTLSHCGNVG